MSKSNYKTPTANQLGEQLKRKMNTADLCQQVESENSQIPLQLDI